MPSTRGRGGSIWTRPFRRQCFVRARVGYGVTCTSFDGVSPPALYATTR